MKEHQQAQQQWPPQAKVIRRDQRRRAAHQQQPGMHIAVGPATVEQINRHHAGIEADQANCQQGLPGEGMLLLSIRGQSGAEAEHTAGHRHEAQGRKRRRDAGQNSADDPEKRQRQHEDGKQAEPLKKQSASERPGVIALVQHPGQIAIDQAGVFPVRDVLRHFSFEGFVHRFSNVW
jgi:hypothetical protein